MESTVTAYIALICVSGVLNFFLFVYAFSRKERFQGATSFMLYTLALTIYCFSYAIGLTSSSMEQIMFWTTIQYIGMPAAASLGLVIVLQFLGKQWNRKQIASLFILPAITLLLVATNDSHHLYYKSIQPHAEYGLPLLDIEIGPWYVVQGIFTFSCMFYAFILLLVRLKHIKSAYRAQHLVLMCGHLVPMATAFLYLIGATPAGIDPVPIVMCISSGLYIWAILSVNMLSLLPIAKETIFDNMSEGVIVLDSQQRLIDFNAAAKKMFPAMQHSMIGLQLDRVWKQLTDMNFPLSPLKEQASFDFSLDNGYGISYFQARTSQLQQGKRASAGSLIMMIDMTELKQLQQELEHQAYYDGLTRIYNRTQFFKISSQLLQQAQAKKQPFSLILFDIDRFKLVNDSYGHDAGDQLLIHVVQCCKHILPEDALFARYGGEEFIVALWEYSSDQVRQLADAARLHIASQPLYVNNLKLNATASFGIAHLQPGNGQTLQALLIEADQALYSAKRNGRNQVVVK